MTKHEKFRELCYQRRLRIWEERQEAERKFVEQFWDQWIPSAGPNDPGPSFLRDTGRFPWSA